MLRSLLFAPGDSEKKMLKASTIGADCVILDLEDSVAEARKPLAREMVRDFLKAKTDSSVKFSVRVNTLDSGMILNDLATVIPAAPDGVVFPKSNGLDDVICVSHYMDVLEAEHGIAQSSIAMLPLISETAAAIFTLRQ